MNTTIKMPEATALAAAKWALSKIGCPYSQARRLQEKVFDCSSLVARAYIAQGKKWFYGGSVPISCNEVYDDEFELLWPSGYSVIGKKMGGKDEIAMATQPGDIQFACTDSGTTRSNKITHVAMVADRDHIVHARGTKYGVVKTSISTYSGKICALVRYNPNCTLRPGMKGYRVQRLQKALNEAGIGVAIDGHYADRTTDAVKDFQNTRGLSVNGQADAATLDMLNLQTTPQSGAGGNTVTITGDTVNLRIGPGKDYDIARIAHSSETYNTVDTDLWMPILVDDSILWVSRQYISTNQ